MTKDEITKIIDKKGAAIKPTFYSLYAKMMENIEEIDSISNYDYECIEDTIATFAYNCITTCMDIVLDNAEYFEKNYKVMERNRVRLRKDLETMPYYIEYPKDAPNWNYYGMEQILIEPLRTKIESIQKNH